MRTKTKFLPYVHVEKSESIYAWKFPRSPFRRGTVVGGGGRNDGDEELPKNRKKYHTENFFQKNAKNCNLHTQYFNLSLMNSGPKLKKYINVLVGAKQKNIFFLLVVRKDGWVFCYKKNSYFFIFSVYVSCFASHTAKSVSVCSLSNNTSYVRR